MTQERESWPMGNRPAEEDLATTTNISSISAGSDISKDAAQTCPNCMDFYLSGHLEGQRHAALTQDQQAENAARRFFVMEAHQEWLSKFVPATVSAMEVEAYRRKPGSSYIPRDGDPRYMQPVGGGAQ